MKRKAIRKRKRRELLAAAHALVASVHARNYHEFSVSRACVGRLCDAVEALA
jgi:hypothetical protein